MCSRFRASLRLIAGARSIQFDAFPRTSNAFGRTVAVAVHRYQESIAGRSYLIEVANVAPDRWRAYLVRIPGVPNALMPFYGPTPDDAAGQLRAWLTRAHERAASS